MGWVSYPGNVAGYKMEGRQFSARFSGRRPNTRSLPLPISSLPRKEDQYKLLVKMRASALCGREVFCPRSLHTTPTVNKTIGYFNKERKHGTGSKTGGAGSSEVMKNGSEQMEKCSRTFSLIIQNAPQLYSSLLSDIKWGYDAYLNTLLHQSVDYWKTQQNTSDLTSSGSISHPVTPPNGGRGSNLSSEREDIEREIKLLERKAMAYLEENERLERILEEEKELENSEDFPQFDHRDIASARMEPLGEGMVDYTDHVTHLQQLILNHRSEALSSMNHRLEQVPVSVCQKLEQCIRSTELCIQQLKKQNSILIANVQELERKLQRYFEILRTPKSDIEILLTALQDKASLK